MTDVIVSIPIGMMKQLREKVNGMPGHDEQEDQTIVLWVLETYLDEDLNIA